VQFRRSGGRNAKAAGQAKLWQCSVAAGVSHTLPGVMLSYVRREVMKGSGAAGFRGPFFFGCR